jgi:hypothetical protein
LATPVRVSPERSIDTASVLFIQSSPLSIVLEDLTASYSDGSTIESASISSSSASISGSSVYEPDK